MNPGALDDEALGGGPGREVAALEPVGEDHRVAVGGQAKFCVVAAPALTITPLLDAGA